MRILDLSAGNRAIWFDKRCEFATYLDIRPEVEPDIVADSRALPAEILPGFDMVVFDPPHVNTGARSKMSKSYGHHTAKEIADIICGTAKEAHRVTRPDALMAFKWNNHDLTLARVLELMLPYWRALFGHGVSDKQRAAMRSETSWVILVRGDPAP